MSPKGAAYQTMKSNQKGQIDSGSKDQRGKIKTDAMLKYSKESVDYTNS